MSSCSHVCISDSGRLEVRGRASKGIFSITGHSPLETDHCTAARGFIEIVLIRTVEGESLKCVQNTERDNVVCWKPNKKINNDLQ